MLRRSDYGIALALALVVLILGVWRLVPRVSGVFHDDAIYVSTAKALAEGHGYRLINLPDAPRQTKYPILYPAILAIVWKSWPVFPDNLVAMQLISLLSAAAALGLIYLYLVRFEYCSRLTAALAVLLSATTPLLLYIGTLTLSEMPFTLLATVALWRVDADLRNVATTRLHQLVTGVLLGTPYLCRTLGLSLIIAALVVLVWRRKPMVVTMLGTTAMVAPWMLWSAPPSVAWEANPIIGYYTDYAAGWSPPGLDALRVATLNLLLLGAETARIPLTAIDTGLKAVSLANPTPMFLLGAMAWVYVARRARHGDLLFSFVLLYGTVICLWPWRPWRFVIPILPFLVTGLASAVAAVARRFLGRPRHQYVLAAAGLVAIVGNVIMVAGGVRASHRDGYPYAFAPEVTATERVSWNAFEDLFAWIRSHAGKDEIMASGLDTMVALYTGRPAFRPWVHRPLQQNYGFPGPRVGTPEELLDILRRNRARYLVNVPMASTPFQRLVEDVAQQYPDSLVLVYRGADPRLTVFEVR
ncbi:MAG TPA: glycosyltransferase family 39 protein [Vicinamibacterales bacterium]|nr:glycosyltransferase family 39 protein [Vicinamibacterales bacterium]